MKANKKLSIAAIALGICALSCAASGAVAFAAEAQTTEPTTILTMSEGASIRNFTPTGIRFTSELSTTKYNELIGQGCTFSTLIVPASYVPEGGITKENYNTINAAIVQAKNSIAVDELAGKVTFSGTLVGTDLQDFPTTFYNVPLTAVSYYANAEGTIVEFASNPQTYSIAYIASALLADGQTGPYYTQITNAVLSEGISFDAQSYSLNVGETKATTLNSQGLKAKYTSNNENVVTVDKDGKLTGVDVGTATVTATIGDKTTTANVTVNSIFSNNPTYSDGTRMFAESVDESGNVSVTPARDGNSEREATFNIEAGTQYYAEATFTYNIKEGSASGSYPMIGLAHFNTLNEEIAEGDTYNNAGELLGRRCIESVLANTGKFFIKDLQPSEAQWFVDNATKSIYLNKNFKDVTKTPTMKIAIARNGNTIYTFVDGKLVDSSDIAWDYWDGKLMTTPGIISCGNANEFTASNITVLSGVDAQTKLNEVTTAASVFGNNPTYPTTGGYEVKTYREYLGEDGDVKIKSDRGGEIAATFNINKGTQYYAEATFAYNVATGTAAGSYPMIGLAHFNALNTTVDTSVTDINNGAGRYGRRCIESVLANNGKFFIKDLKTSETHWYDNNTTQSIYLKEKFKTDVTQITTMTIAIARTEDKMYTFVDGVLVKEYDVPADYSGDTTPGIITCGNANAFTVSNIKLLSGADAVQAKINALTGANA